MNKDGSVRRCDAAVAADRRAGIEAAARVIGTFTEYASASFCVAGSSGTSAGISEL
jgi:hypothetical protein